MKPNTRQFKELPRVEPRLATAGGGQRGGGPPSRMETGDIKHRPPSLTETFNRAAQSPAPEQSATRRVSSKAEIEILEKKRSQPRLACDYFGKGNVNNAINTQRDRKISERIAEIKERLADQAAITAKFNKAAPQPTLTRKFNQASLGRGL